MKRILVVSALLVMSAGQASADHMLYNFYDTIRPNGHRRPDAVGEAASHQCDARFGVQYLSASAGYRKCMRSFGYRYVSKQLVRTPGASRSSSGDEDTYIPPVDNSPPSETILPDTTPVQPIIPDLPAPVDIHPFCPNTIC
jgi:hypothetical protein